MIILITITTATVTFIRRLLIINNITYVSKGKTTI